MQYKARLTLYVDPSDIDELKGYATAQHASVSGFAGDIIRQHLKRLRRVKATLDRAESAGPRGKNAIDYQLPGQEALTWEDIGEATGGN